MKKLVKLTGSNLSRIVKKVIKEQLEDELDLSGSNDWDNIYGAWQRAVETGEAHGGNEMWSFLDYLDDNYEMPKLKGRLASMDKHLRSPQQSMGGL